MEVTVTPAPRSSLTVRVELPPERLDAAIAEAVRHLSQRTRIAGFRPGKAPRAVVERVVGREAVLEEAMDHLTQRAYRDALVQHDILPLTPAEVSVEQAEEGKPVVFSATVQVRPEVELGDYRNFNFKPEIETVDDAKVDRVVEELRDQNATLAPVEDRGAKTGDYAVIGYEGTRDGTLIEGAKAERMPLILGDERLIPGFEDNVVGLRPGETKGFDLTFPEDYPEASLAGQPAHFEVELKELREKILPEADDAFAQSLGRFDDLAALRAEVKARLERNALDHARHDFADKIIEYATANATLDLPDVLVDQEIEIMHDELRGALARQGVTEDAYLKAAEKSEADLHADFRPRAEKRVKVLLVLSKVAEAEGVEVPDADVEVEVRRARERYGSDRKTVAYFESERGRGFIRSTLRRSRVVEKLIDEWLSAHPEHGPLPHIEDDEPAGLEPPAEIQLTESPETSAAGAS
ncbi:MAG TPA: trigger factor [Candidatus Deferrimicrobiaceae bacterium]|nr:trigger factor [Candidatus Deferrimicrobiaceae bacterium]